MGVVTIEPEGPPGCDPDRLVEIVGKGRSTIGELFGARVARTPSAPFVISGHRSWTYAEAWHESRRFAGFLCANGINRGRVAAFLPKSPEGLWTWFGSALTQNIFVAINYMHRGAVLKDLLARSGAELLVTDHAGLN